MKGSCLYYKARATEAGKKKERKKKTGQQESMEISRSKTKVARIVKNKGLPMNMRTEDETIQEVITRTKKVSCHNKFPGKIKIYGKNETGTKEDICQSSYGV